MTAAVDAERAERPTVFTPPLRPARATVTARLIAAGVAAGCLVVLGLAAYLAPDPAGVGTTARLGLEPCGFLRTTGIPCAGCGLTTAFNHAVRWQWFNAFWVQPLGLLLALLTPIVAWAAAYLAVTGRPVHRLVGRAFQGRAVGIVVGSVAIVLVAWGWKLVVTVLSIEKTG